jgi:hypothetical protein
MPSDLCQLWMGTNTISSSRYVANQMRIIDQLTGVELFCEANEDW